MTVLRPKFSNTDRIVRARKDRVASECRHPIAVGDDYLDLNPPERQNGYFTLCVPCAVARGLVMAVES